MASKRILRVLLSSLWLRTGAITLTPLVFVESVLHLGGSRPSFRLESRLLLLFVAAGALELWLRTDKAKAITAPLTARIRRSRLAREFKKLDSSPIANSVTLTGIMIMLMGLGMMAAMMAVFACLNFGFSHHVVDAVLDAWWLYAGIAGFGTLWLIFYHAGLDPQRTFDRLFLWGGVGAIGFFAGLIWAAYTHSTEFNPQHNPEAQRHFHEAMLSAPAPCVAVQDKLSDLRACTVFGLRPGMTQSEVLGVVNGSGYFRREKPENCRTGDKCSHYVTFMKDGLYLRVEFKIDPKSPAPEEQVMSIVLALDERANPYFDENQMMDKFLKRFGPNGSRIDSTHVVWTDIMNDLQLLTYTYEEQFWAVFSRIADRPNSSGVPV